MCLCHLSFIVVKLCGVRVCNLNHTNDTQTSNSLTQTHTGHLTTLQRTHTSNVCISLQLFSLCSHTATTTATGVCSCLSANGCCITWEQHVPTGVLNKQLSPSLSLSTLVRITQHNTASCCLTCRHTTYTHIHTHAQTRNTHRSCPSSRRTHPPHPPPMQTTHTELLLHQACNNSNSHRDNRSRCVCVCLCLYICLCVEKNMNER